MDYLNALPVEVWDEIIKNVTDISDYMSLPDSRILNPTKYIELKSFRQSQNTLAQLLLTSKTFCALLVPFLYRQVYIDSSMAYDGFLASAKVLSCDSNNYRRGDWTKEVYVLEHPYSPRNSPPEEVRLDEILLACPNTVVLSVYSVRGIRRLDCSNDDWRCNLQYISLCVPEVDSKYIRRLSIHCPQLNTVRLEYCEFCEGMPPEEITFPSLTQLSLYNYSSSKAMLQSLYGPQLQTIYVEWGGSTEIRTFLEKHASTLTHLRIYVVGGIDMGELEFPEEVVITCRQLKRLSFEPDRMKPLSIQAPHKQLSHLTFFWREHVDLAGLAEHAAVFSPSMFPNLSLVTLFFPKCTIVGFEAIQENIFTRVMELFPQARVQAEMEGF